MRQSFATSLALLDEYIAEHGDTVVPQNYVTAEGFRLGVWVKECRRPGRITAEQVAQLDERGFVWDAKIPAASKVSDRAFAASLARLDEFIAEHGHARVPVSYVCPDGYTLGYWAAGRRAARRGAKGRITAEQIAQLDARGFVWDASPI